MKVSRTELQSFFADELPNLEALADAFTFHAFEIDGIEGDELDVKVLPNRAADCSTAEGIARELAAILNVPLKDAGEPSYDGQPTVEVTIAGTNAVLGTEFSREEILGVFARLAFKVEEAGDVVRVTAPTPRTDIVIPEDVVEEVGQILGYDRVPATELPALAEAPKQARWRGIEHVKDFLVEKGFTEISTQSFAKKGEILLENPFDKTKPALRMNLEKGMKLAVMSADQYQPLFSAPGHKINLFEIGEVFTNKGEKTYLAVSKALPELDNLLGIQSFSLADVIHYDLEQVDMEKLGKDYVPARYKLSTYRPFSVYPFMTRDISMWIPDTPDARGEILKLFGEKGTELLQQVQLVDQFTNKEGRQSLAFRLIFQSFDRTLTDEEVNGIMDGITVAVTEKGYEVR